MPLNSARKLTPKCTMCGWSIGLIERECLVCKSDVGFPNVRYAERADEKEALAQRVEEAKRTLAAEPQTPPRRLEELRTTRAVMNRHLGALSEWLENREQIFHSYHHQVRTGLTAPTQSAFDEQRITADNAINPYYYESLNFAALSLDGQGMTCYGPYTVALRETTFAHRTTVFTGNPFDFLKVHQVVAGAAAPLGHRAPWRDRGELALAKLAAKHANASKSDLSALVMGPDRSSHGCDYIEVHIFGSIHASSIELVRGPRPALARDRPIWNRIKRKLAELGAQVEETECER